ncbi:MAG: phosphoserine phosphatase SerB [Gemmatimonadaceae bacterium]
MIARAFASVVLDVDSTLAGIEGIDWLAERRGGAIAARVTELTEAAMTGAAPLDAIYRDRLALIRPTVAEVRDLAQAYTAAIAEGAVDAIAALHQAEVRVVLVSGGLRMALEAIARLVGVPLHAVYGVDVHFDSGGQYTGYASDSPLTTSAGKRTVVAGLSLRPRALAVGDGATDAAIRPVVDAFAAYTGFVRRESVVQSADFEVGSFRRLAELVLG